MTNSKTNKTDKFQTQSKTTVNTKIPSNQYIQQFYQRPSNMHSQMRQQPEAKIQAGPGRACPSQTKLGIFFSNIEL